MSVLNAAFLILALWILYTILLKPLYLRYYYTSQGIPFYPFVPIIGNMA